MDSENACNGKSFRYTFYRRKKTRYDDVTEGVCFVVSHYSATWCCKLCNDCF